MKHSSEKQNIEVWEFTCITIGLNNCKSSRLTKVITNEEQKFLQNVTFVLHWIWRPTTKYWTARIDVLFSLKHSWRPIITCEPLFFSSPIFFAKLWVNKILRHEISPEPPIRTRGVFWIIWHSVCQATCFSILFLDFIFRLMRTNR